MGLIYRTYLDDQCGHTKLYVCSSCKSHLSTAELLISKDFHGVHGKAYLFNDAVNVNLFKNYEEKAMTTGKHVIQYISCSGCDKKLGWKYVKAFERSQKYKEGKYILEKYTLEIVNPHVNASSDSIDSSDSSDSNMSNRSSNRILSYSAIST